MEIDFYKEKQIIGRLIGYYRNKKSLEDKRNFTKTKIISYKSAVIKEECKQCSKQCVNRVQICALDTLQRIEGGVVVKNICYYKDLSYKIGYEFNINRKDCEMIDKNIILLDKYYNENNINKLTDLLKEVEYELLLLDKRIYFSQMLQIIQAIINYKLYAVFPNDDVMNLILFLEEYLDERLKQYVYVLFYEYYSYVSINKNKSSYYLNKIINVNSSFLEYKLIEMTDSVSNIELLNFIQEVDLSLVTIHEQFQLIQKKAHLYLNLSHSKAALVEINKSIDLINTNPQTFSKLDLVRSYCRRGVVYYELKQYEEAYQDFKKVALLDVNRLLFNLILFIDVLEKTGRNEEKKKYINSDVLKKITNNDLKIIYKYYLLRENATTKGDYKDVAEYIVEALRPLIPSDIIYYPIILKDLIYFCDKLSAFRYIRDFVNVE